MPPGVCVYAIGDIHGRADLLAALHGEIAIDAAQLTPGTRTPLAQAIEAEVQTFLAAHAELVDDAGRRRLVRNGFLPERTIQTGIGPVAVRQPRVRDRGPAAGGAKIQFTSSILPRYLRRTRSLEELLPWLYLKGISSGDFAEALSALLGPDAPGLSATTISRLKEAWQAELAAWQGRSLAGKRYVYFWVDGVYFNARLGQERQCILVVIGADELGRKELVGLTDGYRESDSRGASCWWICAAAAWRSARNSLSATATSGSGRRCARSMGPRASSAVGCTRPPTF